MSKGWSIPAGMRDWLPGEAGFKRELINTLLANLGLWGYEEIATPVLEFYQVLINAESPTGPDHLYKLIDRDGSILALRPEMTTPIARVISGKMNCPPPWRLMYGAEVFRYEQVQTGRQREFTQVGVELVGCSGPQADSEVLALAIESLRKAGLEKFKVSLGHTGVLRGLLASLALEESQLTQVRNLVLEKDFVGLNYYLEKSGLAKASREQIIELLTKQLNLKQLKEPAGGFPAGIRAALDELSETVELVEHYGLAPYLQLDLSTLRSQDYYTGMVFEIYTSGLGYPIGGGGRYDDLIQAFGQAYPATGFALGVERLLLSLAPAPKEEGLFLVAGNKAVAVAQKAQSLRLDGKKTIALPGPVSQTEAAEAARQREAILIWCGEE